MFSNKRLHQDEHVVPMISRILRRDIQPISARSFIIKLVLKAYKCEGRSDARRMLFSRGSESCGEHEK